MVNSGLFSIVLLVVLSVCLTVTGFPFKNGNAQYWKRMCEDIEEVTDNSTCTDGVYKNPCGKFACLGGIRSDCDDIGSPFRHGRCADGLLCVCKKCTGCLRSECYSKAPECANKAHFLRGMNKYPIEYSINYSEY